MIENRPWVTFVAHATMILGVVLVAFPVWVTFVAASHDQVCITQVPLPLLPGDQFFVNLKAALFKGVGNAREQSVGIMLFNSLVMALAIAIGKIAISLLSAFAIVYFRFPFRMAFFWMIFLTLMLPVEVRILPTFEVIANLEMLNSYAGLTIPLIASATATFIFRQVFLTVPDEFSRRPASMVPGRCGSSGISSCRCRATTSRRYSSFSSSTAGTSISGRF